VHFLISKEMYQPNEADVTRKVANNAAQKQEILNLDALLMNHNQQQPLFNSNTLPQNQIQHAHELISFWKKNNLNSLKVNQKLNISNYNKNDHILNSDFSFSF
jgi:hypothetical protein